MNVTRALIGLSPRPFRERWGTEIEDEAQVAGHRAWPNLLITMLGLWIHPALWPASSAAVRRVRAATLAITVTAIGWLLGHAVLELSDALPRSLIHSWILDSCDALTFLGFLLVLPLPRRHLPELIEQAVRQLAIPALLCLAVIAVANSGLGLNDKPLVRLGLLATWWFGLAAGAIQCVRLVASLDLSTVTAPGPGRLRAGLRIAGLGLGLSGGLLMTTTVSGGSHSPASIIVGAALLLLAIATAHTSRDLTDLA